MTIETPQLGRAGSDVAILGQCAIDRGYLLDLRLRLLRSGGSAALLGSAGPSGADAGAH